MSYLLTFSVLAFTAALAWASFLYGENRQLRADKLKLSADLQEWQSKFLVKVSSTPLYHEPPKPPPVVDPAPIGISAKRAQLAKIPSNGQPSDEQILEAAGRAASSNGNGGTR
jgi:hypothetical protein